MKKFLSLLPIGTRVVVHGTHKGHVAGYGFQAETVAAYGAGHDVATRPYYLVRLDAGFWAEGRTMFVSTITASPDNVTEEKSEDGK